MNPKSDKGTLIPNVCPGQVQNCELVLEGDYENYELLSAHEDTAGPPAINVEHSSDVIIGPVTRMSGPVTIYQNVAAPATRNNLNIECEAIQAFNGQIATTTGTSSMVCRYKVKCLTAIFLTAATLAVSVTLCAVYLTTAQQPSTIALPETTPEGKESHKYLNRSQWGGRPPLKATRPSNESANLVIIAHTATTFCHDVEECSGTVVGMQNSHMGQGSYDIRYNFLIGGDENIYIGRGWDDLNFYRKRALLVSFIGSYHLKHILTKGMIDASKQLLFESVFIGKLTKDYILLCHNQTKATLSPGRNVYEEFKKWPNFSRENLIP